MLTILLHSSKTMRQEITINSGQKPSFLRESTELADYLKTLTPTQVSKHLQVSDKQTSGTRQLLNEWSPVGGNLTIDSFIGDIYSGLQAANLTEWQRNYANQHLLILSGLYGVLRPLDVIQPYRLEMGYRLPDAAYSNLYRFWGTKLAQLVPEEATVINTSAVEYSKAILPHIKNTVITPKFLSISPKTGQPSFVAVHAKIARGAMARWLIVYEINDTERLPDFGELGYSYHPELSTATQPVFICQEFSGRGLSIRTA